MDRNEILDEIKSLNEAELEELRFRLGVPRGVIPGASAAPLTRSIAILEWVEGRSRLKDLEGILGTLRGGGVAASASQPAVAELLEALRAVSACVPAGVLERMRQENEGFGLDRETVPDIYRADDVLVRVSPQLPNSVESAARNALLSLQNGLNGTFMEPMRLAASYRNDGNDEMMEVTFQRAIEGLHVTGAAFSRAVEALEDTIRQLPPNLKPGSDNGVEPVKEPNDAIPIDIGLVIALREEFRVFKKQVSLKKALDPVTGDYYYLFDGPGGALPYRGVALFIGGMAPERATLAAERLLVKYQPATVVSIGIAGSLDSEVCLGDVVVADQVDGYLSSSKAVDSESGGFEFKLSGDPYKSTPQYIKGAENLEFAHDDVFDAWMERCSQRLQLNVPEDDRKQLEGDGFLNSEPDLHKGHTASGPAVSSSAAFVAFLLERDRKFLAVEMEAVGVMLAAHTRDSRTLVIRGISDLSDDRKKSMDNVGKGALRTYAMQNAVDFLWALLEAGILERSENPS